MAIKSVKAYLNGTWYSLTYNSSTAKYEATLTAPGSTSYNLDDHVYAMQVQATNTAGTVTTVDTTDATVGDALKLRVLETVPPTISVTSPGAGSYVANNKQPIVFQLRDESGGSGIDLSALALSIDGGTAAGSSSAGMTCSAVTNVSDGTHNVTILVSDHDGNAAAQASRAYTVDTVPPVLNVTNPANNFLTNTAALTVQGTTNDATSSAVTVKIKLNGVDQGAVTVSGGAFTKSLTLASGSNAIVVTATDAAGKVSTVTLTGTLDTSVPVIGAVTITPNPADTGETMIVSVTVTG